mgnify:CR=1 FL=1
MRIYLSNKGLIEDVVSRHPSVQVNDKPVKVRRLLTPARRVIMSNVCSCIPHTYLKNLVQTLGFNLVTDMTFMRASIRNEEYKHVLNFWGKYA